MKQLLIDVLKARGKTDLHPTPPFFYFVFRKLFWFPDAMSK
ncbi:MAG: hypothetical protein ACJ749_18105 [Flavisolibacter sp.]